MRTFLADVTVFNGRFDRTSKAFRVEAGNIRTAVIKAAWRYRDFIPPRSRVEGLTVHVRSIKGSKAFNGLIVAEEP